MNYMRQRTRNDCAYTCLVMVLREDWTLLKTKLRVLQNFRRSVQMNPNRIPVTAKNKHSKVYVPHPYGHLMGLNCLQMRYTLMSKIKDTHLLGPCRMDRLKKNLTYILTVKSLNYHNCLHCIVYRNGRIWDPSNKKRYVYRADTKVLEAMIVSDFEIEEDIDDDFDQMTDWIKVKINSHLDELNKGLDVEIGE